MKKNNNIGEALFSDAASAFLDDIDNIAQTISPQEAIEYREVREEALRIFSNNYDSYDEQLPMAAEEYETYKKKE
ncbi:MAG: hypothetical protein IKA41_02695 [Bacteroidaceae bacterium]|nr:hypothetical protein [Bacteroidaceae bacterium]